VDRHLLPDEIDLLLDGEVGFGTAPLKAHVRGCAHCRAELDTARALVRELEHLPLFTPSPLFATRVMSQVQVFVPWHVALLDGVRSLIPRSPGLRWAVGSGLATVAVLLTVISAWALTRIDSVVFAADMVLDRARAGAMGALATAVSALFGEAALQALHASGPAGLAAALALLLVAAIVATTALRVVAVRSRSR
jgi:hypothetical protein